MGGVKWNDLDVFNFMHHTIINKLKYRRKHHPSSIFTVRELGPRCMLTQGQCLEVLESLESAGRVFTRRTVDGIWRRRNIGDYTIELREN